MTYTFPLPSEGFAHLNALKNGRGGLFLNSKVNTYFLVRRDLFRRYNMIHDADLTTGFLAQMEK